MKHAEKLSILLTGLVCAVSSTKTQASSGPSPLPKSITMNIVQAKAICRESKSSMRLNAYAVSGDYLLCSLHDEYTGGQQLYKKNRAGQYVFIRGGSESYRASDLVKLANVPTKDAEVLVKTVDEQRKALNTGRLKPSPQFTPYILRAAQVKRLCVPADVHNAALAGWNFVDGYLLCNWTDGNTGGVSLYKKSSRGKFILVGQDGGGYSEYDLKKFEHVPPATAKALSKLHL